MCECQDHKNVREKETPKAKTVQRTLHLFHDVIQICAKFFFVRDHHGESVFFLSVEGFWFVDASLEQYGVDGISEELADDRGRAHEADDTSFRTR